MGHGRRLGVLLVAALALPASAFADPPPNDDFAASLTTTSTAPVAFPGTLDGATSQPGEPHHAGADWSGQTVWYGWKAPRSGRVTMSTCDARTSAMLNTQLAVYTGSSVDALQQVAADEDAWDDRTDSPGRQMCVNNQLSVVSFQATAGTPYRIAVAGLGREQTFTLDVSYGPFGYLDGSPGFRVNPRLHPLTFRLLSPVPGAQMRCRMDGDPFGDCAQFQRFWDRSFSEGGHTLQVTASDAGETFAFPESVPFTVDTVAPDTSLSAPPRDVWGDGEWWEVPVHSSEGGQQQYFACSIDGAAPLNCSNAVSGTSDAEIGLIYMCDGTHTIDTSAVDQAGNVDPTPVRTTVTFPKSDDGGPCEPPSISGDITSTPTGASIFVAAHAGGLGSSFATEYGRTTAYGERTAWQYAGGGGALDRNEYFDDSITFLEPSTTYHARLVATNPAGTTIGPDITFTTAAPQEAPPTARVTPAAAVTDTTAALNGVLSSPRACSDAYFGFDIGTGPSYGTRLTSSAAYAACDAGEQAVRLVVTGLRPGTTYHYRLLVANSGGVARSADATFTTMGTPPSGDPGSAGTIGAPEATGATTATTATPAEPDAQPGDPAPAPGAAAAAEAFSAMPAPAEAPAGTPTPVSPRTALRMALTTLAAHLPREPRLTFIWPAAGRLTLRWHAGRRTLGTARGTRRHAGRQAIRLRMTRAGRAKRLPRSELVATFTPARGAAFRATAKVRARRG